MNNGNKILNLKKLKNKLLPGSLASGLAMIGICPQFVFGNTERENSDVWAFWKYHDPKFDLAANKPTSWNPAGFSTESSTER